MADLAAGGSGGKRSITFPREIGAVVFVRLVILAAIVAVFLAVLGCAGPSQAGGNGGGISINTSVKVGEASALPAATSGQLYNAKIDVSGGSGPYRCSLDDGSLPGDLVFSEPGCTITGTAPVLGPGTPTATYPIPLVVTDSQGSKGTLQLTLVVNQPAPKLVLPDTIDAAEIGKPYMYNFCVPYSQSVLDCALLPGNSGGTPPFTFTVSRQPIGLSMSTNGVLSGTVPEGAIANTYGLVVCATDLVGTETCAETNLPVNEKPAPKVEECNSPYDGKWEGSVVARGTRSTYDEPSVKTPYEISYTFEMTLKCDYSETNSRGNLIYWENVTYAKVSHPFFGCTAGCTPMQGYAYSNFDMEAPGGEAYGSIDFPNGMELGGAGLKISGDGKSMVYQAQSSGNPGSARNDGPPYIDRAGCTGCYADQAYYRIEIHKAG